MKFKKTLSTLLISVSILGTITPANSIFAEEDCQAPTVQQNQQVVTIPDVNLKKALNKVLEQEENHEITADQLATIEKLDLLHSGIKSIEGLQYCKNLKRLTLGGICPSCYGPENFNQVTDLTPLSGLTKLTKLGLYGLPVTDFSPLKNLSIKEGIGTYMGGYFEGSVTLHANNTFSYKLPEYIGMDGQVIDFSGAIESCKENLAGGIYDKATQTITWPCEAFYKYMYYSNRHPFFNWELPGLSKCSYFTFYFPCPSELLLGDRALDLTFVLFENKEPASGKLASDITQETITKAREEIEKLDDNYNQWAENLRKYQSKADLLEWINKAQQLFNQQEPSSQTIVNIPDKNLEQALMNKLGTKEITVENLATIEDLDIDDLGISSIEGLQHCTNLKSLKIGKSLEDMTTKESNTIADLSPLKNLKNLKVLSSSNLKITDFSPLNNLNLEYATNEDPGKSFIGHQIIDKTINSDTISGIKIKNDYINMNGKAFSINEAQGSEWNYSYETETNNIVINCLSEKVLEKDLYTGYDFSIPIDLKNESLVYGQVDLRIKVHVNSTADKLHNSIEHLFTDKEYSQLAKNLTIEQFENIIQLKEELAKNDSKVPAPDKYHKQIENEDMPKYQKAGNLFFTAEVEKLFVKGSDNNKLKQEVTQEQITKTKNNCEKCVIDNQEKEKLLKLINKAQQLYDQQIPSKSLEITLDKYIIGATDTIIGTYNDMNAKFLRIEVNGEKKTLISSKALANGQIKYYVGKDLKASDDVQVVLFNQNYQEIGRQKVNLEESIITKLALDNFVAGESHTITGSYNGTNAKYERVEVNGEKKALIASKDLANGQIKYYVGKDLKASDDVQVVLFNQNYQEIGRQRVNLEEPIITKLTLDNFVAGESHTITGSYNGTNAKYERVEVNGEKKALIASKDLANGQIKYYVGKDLKASDDVQIVLFDQNYQEIGRQKLVFKN
ncbi:immunoglobulin-like domain-containing protein [Enterococcus sp. C76]|uniref:immunoglobulin-like domain-containing protein n=1 Tax=Enterococcus sp. C76 TaxID=3231334 RepID=UPI0034A085E7